MSENHLMWQVAGGILIAATIIWLFSKMPPDRWRVVFASTIILIMIIFIIGFIGFAALCLLSGDRELIEIGQLMAWVVVLIPCYLFWPRKPELYGPPRKPALFSRQYYEWNDREHLEQSLGKRIGNGL